MDVAYDHIQEEAVSPEEAKNKQLGEGDTANNLNTEVREAYKAFSASPWGAKLGGLWGSVKKQGETYYTEARKEIAAASTEASKGLTDLVNQTKTISLQPSSTSTADSSSSTTSNLPIDPSDPSTFATAPPPAASSSTTNPTTTVNSLSTDSLLSEAQTLLSRFQTVTTARLAQLSKAENAADEALERYGRNLRTLLRDAVTVAPPTSDPNARPQFESKDAEGRRVVHATRFDAQLHVIHTRPSSFTADPVEAEGEYAAWKAGFDIEKKTDDVARDLDKYDELRRAMERLVPGEVAYEVFWTRYYFLRHVVEMEEARRRELVRGAREGGEEEEVGWGDEEEEEDAQEAAKATPVGAAATQTEPTAAATATPQGAATPTKASNLTTSTAPPVPPTAPTTTDDTLRPSEPRRSNEHSVADSDASYDILSAATSRGPGTPAPNAEAAAGGRRVSATPKVAEESEEEDWE